MSKIEIAIARHEDKVALTNLMQLYIHDFSEHWSETSNGELQDDGKFAEYPLDAYWREADRIPLLLKRGGRLIGFALLNAVSHSGRPVERNMAEFFIARKHRGHGAGTVAAQMIFSRYPGLWEVAVARRNIGALAFWRRAINNHPRVENAEERDVASANWNGPIIRFRIQP